MRKGSISLIPVLVVFFSLAAFLGVMYFALPESKTTTTANKNTNPATNTNVDVTNDNVNSAPEEETTSSTTTSYGLWYPFSAGQTINNPRPVIYGKVSQTDKVFLSTTFSKIDWAGRGETDAKTLEFKVGATKNLLVKLDGQQVTDLVGFPQYPMVLCMTKNFLPDGSKLYDENTNIATPADSFYNTEAECRTELSDKMPSVIFVFRPAQDLAAGQHTLEVEGSSMQFTIDRAATVATQSIPKSEQSFYNVFDIADNCSPGYWQNRNSLSVALPKSSNTNLYWGISFPQSEGEKGSINRRHLEVLIQGKQFPVFFPGGLTYFSGRPYTDLARTGDYGLFLPSENLVFSDGSKASMWALRNSTIPGDTYPTAYYYEVFGTDISGREYRGQSLPWTFSVSSGCDG